MASIIDIIFKIRSDAAAVITKTAEDLKHINSAASGASPALDGLANSSGAAVRGVESISSSIKGLIGAFSALLAIGTLKKWADAAAEVQVAGTVLNVVAKNAGITTTSIHKADLAIQSMGITAKASAEGLTKFVQAGLAGVDGEAIGKAKELARAAQDLAVVSGQNSSDTFARMIINIQQMDTMGMRFMGITVTRDVAETKYAASLGKTSAALTEAEKRQAFLNETLVEAKKLQGTYAEAMDDTAKQLTSLPRLYTELYDALGKNLQPAYSALVLTLQDFLKESKAVVLAMNKQSDGGKVLGDTVQTIATAVKDAAIWLIKHHEIILMILEAWVLFKGIVIIGSLLNTVITSIHGVSAALLTMQTAMRTTQAAGVSMEATMTSGLGLQAVIASFGAVGTMGPQIPSILRGITTSIGFLGTALTGLLRFAGPIAFLAVTAYQLYDAFFKTPSTNALGSREISEAKKQIIKDIDALIDAKKEYADIDKKIASAPAGTDTTADQGAKRELEEKRKNAEEEIAITAKKLNMDRKATQEAILLREGELRVKAKIAEIQTKIDDTKKLHISLGGTDKDGQTPVGKVVEDGKLLNDSFKSVMAKLIETKETESEKLARVQVSTGLGPEQMVKEASKAGMELYAYLDKMYPKPTMISSWEDMTVAISASGTAGRRAFSLFSTEFDKFVASAKTPVEVAEALEAVGAMAGLIPERVRAAQESLEFRSSKASLAQLNTALEGFDDKLKTIRSSMETYASLSRDSATNDNKWALMMTQLQGSFKGFGQSLYSVNSDISNFAGQLGQSTYAAAGANGKASVALFKDTSNEVARLANEQAAQEVAIAVDKYNREEAALKASLERRMAIQNEQPASSGENETSRQYEEQLQAYTVAQNRMKQLTEEGVKDKRDALLAQLNAVKESVAEQTRVALEADRELAAKSNSSPSTSDHRNNDSSNYADTAAYQRGMDEKKNVAAKANAELSALAKQQKDLEVQIETEGSGKVTEATRAQYQEQENIARAAKAKMDALSKAVGTSEDQNTARAKEAIDRETNQKRLANAQQLYASLKTLRDQYLSAYKASLEKIQSLEKELFWMQEGKEKDLRDLKRKGMTEEEVQADKLKEYNELIAKAQEATQKGAYDKAKEYAMSAKGIATSLEGIDPTKQASMVSEAWDVATDAVSKNKEETEKTAAAQKKSMDDLATAMTEATKTVKGLTDGEVKAVMIGVDDKSLNEALAKVKDAFEKLAINVNINASAQPDVSRAGGGEIDGPGTETSDSILAALSKNEFVHRAKAVRHYGKDFMHAINSMKIPRGMIRAVLSGNLPAFNMGGLVGSLRDAMVFPTPRFDVGSMGVGMPQMSFSSPSPVQETIHRTELNLTLNKRPIGKVSGSRDTIHNLVNALNEVSGGV